MWNVTSTALCFCTCVLGGSVTSDWLTGILMPFFIACVLFLQDRTAARSDCEQPVQVLPALPWPGPIQAPSAPGLHPSAAVRPSAVRARLVPGCQARAALRPPPFLPVELRRTCRGEPVPRPCSGCAQRGECPILEAPVAYRLLQLAVCSLQMLAGLSSAVFKIRPFLGQLQHFDDYHIVTSVF